MIRMVKTIAIVAVVGALTSASASAEPINLNPLGIDLNTPLLNFNAVDLDPLHIFTPAPTPMASRVVKHRKHHARHMMKK